MSPADAVLVAPEQPSPTAPGTAEQAPGASTQVPDVDVAVIGGGAAGTMAMLRATLYHLRVAHFLGDSDAKRRARAPWVVALDTLPGAHGLGHPLSQQLLSTQTWLESMPQHSGLLNTFKVTVERLERQGEAFRIHWVERRRRSIDGSPRSLLARTVILATGQTEEQPVIQGSIEPIFPFANARQALYSLRSDGHLGVGQRVGVVGHTERAAQVALILHDRYHPPWVGLLTHGQPLSCTDETRQRLQDAGIVCFEAPIQGFLGHARQEGLTGVTLSVGETQAAGQTLELTRLFVAIGRRIYHGLGSALGVPCDDEGYLITDLHGETCVPGLFVAGDLRAGSRQQVTSAWEDASISIDRIEARLRAERTALRR